jgi:hypothetical protein
MAQKSSRAKRPSDLVMEEFAEHRVPWDLDEHLHGCLAGYQAASSYGAAVFLLSKRCGESHAMFKFARALVRSTQLS